MTLPDHPRSSWLAGWASRLRALSAHAIPESRRDRELLLETFRDERGHRRLIDAHVLRHVLGLPGVDVEETQRDAELWRRLSTGEHPGQVTGSTHPKPITEPEENLAIEIWTETELACLHAMWWHARRHPELRPVVESAVAWHLANLQPDNGTNHAWAVHVFVDAAWPEDGELDPEADLHAQGLVHASMYLTGKPDALSALLIADAGRGVEMLLNEPPARAGGPRT